jgi:hypothetical protein
MKHLTWFATALLGAGLLVAQAPPNVKARQERQDARIEKGKADGSLTDAEAKKLEARDKALDEKIRRDRKDGGGLSVKERRRIQKLQNKESKRIEKQRHDKQTK